MSDEIKNQAGQEPRQILYVQHVRPEDDEVEIDLLRVLQIFWQQRKKAAVCVALCALAGFAGGSLMPKHYESTAKLNVTSLASGQNASNPKGYVDGLELKDMPAGVTVKQDAKTNAITLTGSAASPDAALEAAQAGIAALREVQESRNEKYAKELREHYSQTISAAKQEADEAILALGTYGREHGISLPASALQGGDGSAQGYVLAALNVQGGDKDSVGQYLALFNEAVTKQSSYAQAVKDAELDLAKLAKSSQAVETVSEPQLPSQPKADNPKKGAGIGAMLGLLLAFAYAFYLYWPETRQQKQD